MLRIKGCSLCLRLHSHITENHSFHSHYWFLFATFTERLKSFTENGKKKNKEAREKKGSSSAYFQLSWHTFECKVKATLGCCFKAIGVTKWEQLKVVNYCRQRFWTLHVLQCSFCINICMDYLSHQTIKPFCTLCFNVFKSLFQYVRNVASIFVL